jgi:hypothetical protein
LDVSQAFDKVWHPGLLYKIKQHLPTFLPLLKPYLSDRQFRARIKGGSLSPVSHKIGGFLKAAS